MIVIGADHGGYKLKEVIKEYLNSKNIEFIDVGTYSEDSVDYPYIAEKAALLIKDGKCEKGILICGTGVGISIAANKISGIRAALVSDCFTAKATREHNNSNILCMGGRVIGDELAKTITDIWLNTDFVGQHHTKRLELLKELEEKY